VVQVLHSAECSTGNTHRIVAPHVVSLDILYEAQKDLLILQSLDILVSMGTVLILQPLDKLAIQSLYASCYCQCRG
jgi:hypothetical protein